MLAQMAFVCAALLLSLPARAAVTAEPASVTFNSTTQTATVAILSDGKPVPASAMGAWQLYASGNTYEWMMTLRKEDGRIILSPSDQVEVGSYDLVLQTNDGPVTIDVFTPLKDLGSIEDTAAALGISEEELKKRLGLISEAPYARVEIELASVYFVGQAFSLEMPKGDGLSYVWAINGNVVSEGPDKNAFSYVFAEPGPYVLDYSEVKNGVATATARSQTMVVSNPPIPVDVARNTKLEVTAPPDYGVYEWKLDGVAAAKGAVFTHTFQQAGVHDLRVLARNPAQGAPGSFVELIYQVRVR